LATLPPHVNVGFQLLRDRRHHHCHHQQHPILEQQLHRLSNTQKQLPELVTRKDREQLDFQPEVQLRGQRWGLLLLLLRVLCRIIKLREKEGLRMPWGKL